MLEAFLLGVRIFPRVGGSLLLLGVSACGGGDSPSARAAPDGQVSVEPGGGAPGAEFPDGGLGPVDPGEPIELAAPPSEAEFQALRSQLEEARKISRADFDSRYAVSSQPLDFQPLDAVNLELIQASSFALTSDELSALAAHGFVIQRDRTFPHFSQGLREIYADDLPIYVSADSILDAIHVSYDRILMDLERSVLVPGLIQLLSELRERLAQGHGMLGSAPWDLDVYLAVAQGLLEGVAPETLFENNRELARALYRTLQGDSGLEQLTLFGVERTEDASQYKPRGHYEGSPELERYFRAMMWLGRADLRLIETLPAGTTVFRRRQVDTMFALDDLFTPELRMLYAAIDAVIEEFVGVSDYMTLPEVPALMKELGVSSLAETAALSDETIASAIVQGGYGEQLICSHFMVNDGTIPTLPLNRSFALLGQRYVLDSHVFSQVVFDRVEGRMMPNPLDVAFAALGNDQAATLLSSELDTYAYQGALNAMRTVAEAHGETFWSANLYNRWLAALRALSPSQLPANAPSVARGEGWGRRMLNAQLGSWAQLRHDTILYVKQSYTTGEECEFPDAYVEPYPEFFAALTRYADRALAMTDRIEPVAEEAIVDRLRDHFGTMRSTMTMLQAMAERELTGEPFEAEQLAFINQAVRMGESAGCGLPPEYVGWYPRLLWNPAPEYDPTVADVHTQPTDHEGAPVGKVLHVGTSGPRAMIVTVSTCEGSRAYAGVAFSYHELITEDFKRLTDSEWSADMPHTEVPWMQDLIR